MIEASALSAVLGSVDAATTCAGKLLEHSERAHGASSREAQAAAVILAHLERAEGTLRRSGIEAAAVESRNAFDLGALAELDAGRVEALQLAEKLRDLLPLALKLDTARGRVVSAKVPLQPGETPSTDVAEQLSDLCARLEQEAGVGVGKGLE